MLMNILEKRGYARLPLRGAISFRTEGQGWRSVKAYANDVSFGGLALYSRKSLERERIVELELRTKFLEGPLQIKGKIKHVKMPEKPGVTFRMGIEFVDTNKDKVTQLIKNVLRRKDRIGFLKAHEREFLFMLKGAPIIFLVAWLGLAMATKADSSIKQEQAYTQQLKEDALYFLTHEQ